MGLRHDLKLNFDLNGVLDHAVKPKKNKTTKNLIKFKTKI